MYNGQKTSIEMLLEQERELLHLKQLLRRAMGLLAGNLRIYASSDDATAWQMEANARQAWREDVRKALESDLP